MPEIQISRYFILKSVADALRVQEQAILEGDNPKRITTLALYRYSDLSEDNRERVRIGDPNSLIAIDINIGETG